MRKIEDHDTEPTYELGTLMPGKGDRYVQEWNLVFLESAVFDFNKRTARSCTKPRELAIGTGENQTPVLVVPPIKPPEFDELSDEAKEKLVWGLPSVFEYKVFDAAFRKLTEYGYPYQKTIAFSEREIARLAGRTASSGKTAQQVRWAMRLLSETLIKCEFKIKNGKTISREEVDLSLFVNPRFAKRENGTIILATISFHDMIIENLANHHYGRFNHRRLASLEPMTRSLAKQLNYYFAMDYTRRKLPAWRRRGVSVTYTRDYEAACETMLGGLKPRRYKADIKTQLGSHFDALVRVGVLTAEDVIQPKAGGQGWNLEFKAGPGFYEDFWEFKAKHDQRSPTGMGANVRDIQNVGIVSKFFDARGIREDEISEADCQYAGYLVKKHGETAIHDFLAFSLGRLHGGAFNTIDTFRGISVFYDQWEKQRGTRH